MRREKMTKEKRQEIYNKYDGHCYLCGCELKKGWHIDHVIPIIRKYSYEVKNNKSVKVFTVLNPENENIDNLMPACASCNINKRAKSIDEFRDFIYYMYESLKERNVNYQVCERYGLITADEQKEIKFYFEQQREKK